MFNIGFGELLVIFLVGLVVVGPKDLPKVFGWLGRTFRKIRAIISILKKELGWDELAQDTDVVKNDLQKVIHNTDVSQDFASVNEEIKKARVK